MKLVNKKTRKAIRKSVKKLIKKHGPVLAEALAGGALAERLSAALTGDDRQTAPKKKIRNKSSKKKRTGPRKPAQAELSRATM